MAKSLILSNGNIFVGLNQQGLVSDFFYPFVGVENHVRGTAHKIGIFCNGNLSWLDSDEWTKEIDLEKDSFVGISKYYNANCNIELSITSAVYN